MGCYLGLHPTDSLVWIREIEEYDSVNQNSDESDNETEYSD